MTVSKAEPTVIVACPDCGTQRTITVSYQRRLKKEKRPAPCHQCTRAADTEPDDDDWWFWLEAHGVKREKYERYGVSAKERVARHGLPDGLQALVDLLRPEAL